MSHHTAWPLNICSKIIFAMILAGAGPVQAQSQRPPQVAVPVVQAVPQKSAGVRLNEALNHLARNPQDSLALKEAGQASLELGDAAAAIGFYQRALTIRPDDGALKVGLAGAYVLNEDPFTAIDLFDEADRAGPIDPARLTDRGLAYDLVGDSQTAQIYYHQSLAAVPNDETLRRLALSQAISGDRKGMDLTLAPLLQKQDKAAWRTRAFGLAIIGQAAEAEAIARQTMPADMAAAITAYLRYMPRLTAAQQAAAGNLGRFPRAAEIGLDDPRMAAYVRSRVQMATATGTPSAQTVNAKRDARSVLVPVRRVAATVPPPEPVVSRETATASRPVITPPPPGAVVQAEAPLRPASTPVLSPNATSAVSPALAVAEPTPRGQPAPAAQPAPARKPTTLDEAFADLAPPNGMVEPAAGAVDVRVLRSATAARKEPVTKDLSSKALPGKVPIQKELAAKDKADPKAKFDAKAKDVQGRDPKGKDAKGKDVKGKPSHPSRIWVQIAAGRNKSALAFDWRKFVKEDPAVFKGQKPFATEWGQTNRMLTGPFASSKEAEAYLAKVKKSGRSGAFVWTSPAGQIVDGLPAGK